MAAICPGGDELIFTELQESYSHDGVMTWKYFHITGLGPLLLTWFNFNPSMDK